MSAILFAAAVAACGQAADVGLDAPTMPALPTVAGQPTEAERAASEGGLVAVGEGPLSARHQAWAVWTGREVLVLGGRDTPACHPVAHCLAPERPALSDGAAWDPATDTWRAIAAAPRPVVVSGGAVVGERVYLRLMADEPGDAGALVTYDVASDRWEEVALGENTPLGPLVGAGDRLVMWQSSHERGAHPDVVFDPATGSWSALPIDPIGAAYDRVMVWTGAELVLLAKELVANPGSAEPSLVLAAALDLAAGTWRRLPDSEILGSEPRSAGALIVDVSPGSADGGEVNNWGRAYAYGGILDPATGTWSPLPERPERGAPYGLATSGDDVVVADDGWVLNVATSQWLAVPGESSLPDQGRAVTWAGDRLFAWGGVDWDSDGALSGAGSTWQPNWDAPPATPSASPTASADGALDCATPERFGQAWSFGADTTGEPDPLVAIRVRTAEFAPDGDIVRHSERNFSIVVDGREVLTGTLWRLDSGGYVVDAVEGCAELDPGSRKIAER